jgi:outer membrane protein
MTPLIRSAALALLISSVAMAQTPPAGQQPTSAGVPLSSASADAQNERALRLSLADAVTAAVQRNLGVELERYDFRMAGYSAKAAYAPFDWFATADISTGQSERPTFLTLVEPSDQEQTVLNLGLEQTLATGGTYGITLGNNLSNDARLQNEGVEDIYGANLGLTFAQPLLRNFGVDINRRGIRIARNNLAITGEAFRDQLIRTVQAVELAYWDLIYRRQELEVRQQSLTLGRDQERITQIRIDVGASAPLDILQPRVAIATREESVILSEANIRHSEDQLRQLMNLDPAEWDRPIIPTDSISYEPAQVDIQNAVSRALELRPEVRQASLVRENNRVQHVYARNQVLPRADLLLSYGLGGQAAGSQALRDPVTGEIIGTRRGDFGDALDQVTGFDFDSWSVGVEFGVPITNIGARAEARRSELDLDRSRQEETLIRQNIAVEVRSAVRDIDTALRSIAATRTAREAAERNLEAERKRFENGMTTNFNVLLIQQELSDSRSREILALTAYRQALANFHRAVGDILDVHNITVEEPERFTLPGSRAEQYDWLSYDRYAKDSSDGGQR